MFGKSCDKTTSVWLGDVLYVDSSVEAQLPNCGAIDNPCRDLDEVLGMVSDGTVIQLAPSNTVYQLRAHTWLTKSLTIQGPSDQAQNGADKVILSTGEGLLISPVNSPDNEEVSLPSDIAEIAGILGVSLAIDTADSGDNRVIRLTFQQLRIENSGILVGNANINFIEVELRNVNIMQDYIEHKTIESFSLSFERSTISESQISTQPKTVTISGENYQPTFYTVNSASLTVKHSSIDSSSINITAKELKVKVEDSVFNNDLICPDQKEEPQFDIAEEVDADKIEICKQQLKNKGILDTGLHFGIGYSFTEDQIETDSRDKRDVTRYRAKRQTQPAELLKNLITIKRTKFTRMVQQMANQGAVTVAAKEKFDLTLDSCLFLENKRAVSIDVQEGVGSKISIKKSNFTLNNAWGPGGAIHLYQVSGYTTIKIENSAFNHNRALGLTGTSAENNVNGTFEGMELSKISGSGGAIAFNVKSGTCKANIEYSRFQANTADNYGGTLYVTSGVTLTLADNSFYNVAGKQKITRPMLGDMIESRGNIVIMNSDFNVTSAQGDIPVFSYRADGDNAFIQIDQTTFVCPKGL